MPHILAAKAMFEEKRLRTVNKRGPCLARRVKQLGMKGNVPALLVYQDAFSVWHVTQHCPSGMVFPDLNAMVGTYSNQHTHRMGPFLIML